MLVLDAVGLCCCDEPPYSHLPETQQITGMLDTKSSMSFAVDDVSSHNDVGEHNIMSMVT